MGRILCQMFRTASLIILTLMLCSCSYSYDVNVRVADGRLIFDANPQWSADCVRAIEVSADDDAVRALASAGDDVDSVQSGTFWAASVSLDDSCENRFPLQYGATLRGHPWVYDTGGLLRDADGKLAPLVAPKRLRTEVLYTVTTTTGATGYGCGRFIIHRDRTVENVGCS